jgi:hypothetical protein
MDPGDIPTAHASLVTTGRRGRRPGRFRKRTASPPKLPPSTPGQQLPDDQQPPPLAELVGPVTPRTPAQLASMARLRLTDPEATPIALPEAQPLVLPHGFRIASRMNRHNLATTHTSRSVQMEHLTLEFDKSVREQH